jgi:hypothetical protein
MSGALLPVVEGGRAYGRGTTVGGTAEGSGVEGGATGGGAAGGVVAGGATGGGGVEGGATAHAMTVLNMPRHRSINRSRVPIGGRPLTVMQYS